jgi:formamidopyrimidine-DNA glycosylase
MPLTEYVAFRRHLVDAMEKESKTLNKPLCEVLLDQAYFNGVGN